MSEYQYYEFLAIDKPLGKQEQQELRAISTRAEITSTSFINHYSWGDLKANPIDLLKRYFDVFVYVANWGTHRLAIKLPASIFDPGPFEKALGRDLQRIKNDFVLDLCTQDEEGYEDWENDSGRMRALAPLRSELLRGDQRALYLIWLFRVQNEEVSPTMPEPDLPSGLDKLTAAQCELLDFLRIDEHLIEAAVKQSKPKTTPNFKPWITSLSTVKKDGFLLDVIEGKEALVRATMIQQYRQWLEKSSKAHQKLEKLRTAQELKNDADQLQEKARQAEIRRKELERQLIEAERKQHLEKLSKRLEEVWAQVEDLIALKKQESYREAIALLRDLQEIASDKKDARDFQHRIRDIRTRHNGKSSFIRQLQAL